MDIEGTGSAQGDNSNTNKSAGSGGYVPDALDTLDTILAGAGGDNFEIENNDYGSPQHADPSPFALAAQSLKKIEGDRYFQTSCSHGSLTIEYIPGAGGGGSPQHANFP